jgi:hypothetical protein
MAEENGKAKSEVEDSGSSSDEFVPTIKLLEEDAADWGPWTDEDERWFQFMTKEFGGAPE